jgi:hypothetical protein
MTVRCDIGGSGIAHPVVAVESRWETKSADDFLTGSGAPPAGSTRGALAQEAVVWGLPLVLFGRYLDAAVDASVPFNQFFINNQIASPRSRAVGPNIDTLNGRAWLDLSEEPQVIFVPDTADRYYSIQFQDMYMNSFAYVGRRTTGTSASAFAVSPPGFKGTLQTGLTEIKATTSKVFLFVRVLVSGKADLTATRAISGGFAIGALSTFPMGARGTVVGENALDIFQPTSRRTSKSLPHQDLAKSGTQFFAELDRLVRLYPPLRWDKANLERFAALGIGTADSLSRDPDLEAELAAAVPLGVATALGSLQASSDNGWSRRDNVAPFIHDPVQRAANNIHGPGTQVAEESVFFNLRRGPDGEPLSGTHRYRLFFPAEQLPPVDGFWSLTLYDGSYFLFDNALDRYGIADRSEHLRYGPDGSLEIHLQADRPVEGDANWLPTPREEFQLVFRTYQPREPILDRTWRPPVLEITDPA